MAEHGFSQRRACRLIEVDPKTVRREATADAQAVRQRLRELAGERRRFGCRRLGIMLAREGITMNHKKLRSEEHTSELQSLMRISYAVFCLKKKTKQQKNSTTDN